MIDLAALAAWLGEPEVVAEGTPTGGGWSNETIFVRAGERRLVVRLTPAGPSMFPTYDLGHQVRCLALAAGAGLAVPEVLGYEPDPDVLGRPFYVMTRLDGRVPADDDPPFTRAGFLFEATPAEQRTFYDDAVDRIAAVHRVDAPASAATVGPAPGAHLAWAVELGDWAGLSHPSVAAAQRDLAAAVPRPSTPAGFLWGDARPANMVVDGDFAVVGLLDWELAGSGPGELDVAWFLEMNRMRAEGSRIAPLPGFPDEETTWKRWSAAVGRPPADTGWYRLFAAYRIAVLMHLFLRRMVSDRRLPAGHRLFGDNPALRRLGELSG